MRKTFITLAIFFLAFNLKAQYVPFNDANLVDKLKTIYPTCFNAFNQLDTTCPEVQATRKLDISNARIGDFINLNKAFSRLTSLDISGNFFSTFPALPSTLKELKASSSSISAIPNNLPSSLKSLDLSKCKQIMSIANLPPNLEELILTGNYNLTSITTPFPASLKSLNIRGCGLSTINPLPSGLVQFVCAGVSFQSLPTLPSGLQILDCSYMSSYVRNPGLIPSGLKSLYTEYTDLTSLTSLPPNLEEFRCNSSTLKNNTLVPLPSSLKKLECAYCNISTLPILPPNLKYLDIQYNFIKQLALPNSLEYLDCGHNPIFNLPSLPTNLKELRYREGVCSSVPPLPTGLELLGLTYCSFLTSLPALPSTLKRLYVDHSSLTSLPSLPNSITILNASYTFITEIQNIPDSIFYMDFGNTPLRYLPQLYNKNKLKYLYVNNTDMYCLPFLPDQIEIINVSDSYVSCLPNWPASFPLSQRIYIRSNLVGYTELTAYNSCTSDCTASNSYASLEDFCKIGPNPVDKDLFITFNSLTESNLEFSLYNSLGQLVFNDAIPEGQTEHKINLLAYNQGLYHLVIKQNKVMIGKKTIVKE